jgi:hypothetical protein
MTSYGEHRVVSIHVLRVYRGQVKDSVTVLTGVSEGDCGFDFETGKQYLVYASRVDSENLFTSICTGTSALEQAGPALRLLRGEAPTPDDLLDRASFYKKFTPKWTGTACGRVTTVDGRPFGKASVDMTEVRDDPFPPRSASDPNLSKPDGSFCIRVISPGKYLLTAETLDSDHDLRWMGYYPGVARNSEATIIEVTAGANLRDLNFTVRKEPVYTVRFRIETSDGTPPPLDHLMVAINSVNRDGLAYHLVQNRRSGNHYAAGYVPPGHYVVSTMIRSDPSEKIPPELSKWQMVKQEVEIPSDSEIVLKLEPVK